MIVNQFAYVSNVKINISLIVDKDIYNVTEVESLVESFNTLLYISNVFVSIYALKDKLENLLSNFKTINTYIEFCY